MSAARSGRAPAAHPAGAGERRRDAAVPFDVARIRADFPILAKKVRGRPLIYLDNAATSHKPRAVIEALDRYYSEENSNVHRGVHHLSALATRAYELARTKVQKFIDASSPSEIVFVRGTTEAINLVAQSYGRSRFQAGDEVLISAMEHHSNIVPWQLLCEEKRAKLRVAPINDRGELRMEEYAKLLGPRTRLVAMTHVSNALGTINPVSEVIRLAHARGVPVLLDGAQAVPHLSVSVRELDVDFYAFSGHKLFGPTGIGALYGRQSLLEQMPPWQGGGEMISSVTFEKTTFNKVPYRFEAGTPDIAGAIGLGAAIDYLGGIDLPGAAAHEHDLLEYAAREISKVPGVKLIGTAAEKAASVSFILEGVHAHDLGTILDQEGIAIRAGHHCAQPVMERFGVLATARASLAFYNTRAEIDALVAGLRKVKEVFG